MTMKPIKLETVKKSKAVRNQLPVEVRGGLANRRLFPKIRIMLHGLYLGHHFDGGLRGSTGEFYWYSTVSNGNELSIVDSRNAKQFGMNGILTGIGKQTWLDLEFVELFRSEFGPQKGKVTFTFTLMESDDSDEAKTIFNSAKDLAVKVVDQASGSNVTNIGDVVVELFNAIVDADDDDHAIQHISGLNEIQNYKIGQFLRLDGKVHDKRPTFAVCSILPQEEADSDDFQFWEETGMNVGHIGKGKRLDFDIKKDGYLSFFIRVRSSQLGAGVALFDADRELISRPEWTIVKTKKVKQSKTSFYLEGVAGNSKVDARIIYTSEEFKSQFA